MTLVSIGVSAKVYRVWQGAPVLGHRPGGTSSTAGGRRACRGPSHQGARNAAAKAAVAPPTVVA
eukprot:11196132-Lingulodinium_polyedra.AAC.1